MPNTPDFADHAAPTSPFVARARKFVVAVLGVAAMVVTTGVLEEDVEVWVNAVLAVATAAGVFQVRNAPPGPVPHDDTLRA